MATVGRFNVTPVKSMALRHPPEIELGHDGVSGAHRFLVLEADGSRPSTEGKARLLGIRADYDHALERLRLTFPDGDRVQGSADPSGDPITVALFDRKVQARPLDGPFAGALSDHCGRDLRLVRVVEPEYAGGEHRVTLLSRASVEDLGRRGGAEPPPDPRRFRMLVELDDCEPYEEDGWSGRRLRLGEAIVRVGEGVPRCVLTTMHPDTGQPDFPTLKVLATYRRRDGELPLGIYADVERPGRIRVGDPVEPL